MPSELAASHFQPVHDVLPVSAGRIDHAPDSGISFGEIDHNRAIVCREFNVAHGMVVLPERDGLRRPPRLRLFERDLHAIPPLRQCERRHAAQHNRAVLDGDSQLELVGLPALELPNPAHSVLRDVVSAVEPDSNRALKRIGFVELHAARYLASYAPRLVVPAKSDLDVLIHCASP